MYVKEVVVFWCPKLKLKSWTDSISRGWKNYWNLRLWWEMRCYHERIWLWSSHQLQNSKCIRIASKKWNPCLFWQCWGWDKWCCGWEYGQKWKYNTLWTDFSVQQGKDLLRYGRHILPDHILWKTAGASFGWI